jgi:hypothetical protein
VIVRQRIDCAGRATALDAAGPGCVFAFEERSGPTPESAPCDYAATDCIVCLLPRNVLDTSLVSPSPVWRELLAMQQATLYRVGITQARQDRPHRVAMLCVRSPTRSRRQGPARPASAATARLLGASRDVLPVLGDLSAGAVRADGLVIVKRAVLGAPWRSGFRLVVPSLVRAGAPETISVKSGRLSGWFRAMQK